MKLIRVTTKIDYLFGDTVAVKGANLFVTEPNNCTFTAHLKLKVFNSRGTLLTTFEGKTWRDFKDVFEKNDWADVIGYPLPDFLKPA